MKLTDYTVVHKIRQIRRHNFKSTKEIIAIKQQLLFQCYMHHYADTVTEGRGTLNKPRAGGKTANISLVTRVW